MIVLQTPGVLQIQPHVRRTADHHGKFNRHFWNLGAEEFERRIGNARNGFMFGLEMLEKEYDMNSPEGKTAFFQEAARRLIGFEDELERNNYIEAVAGTYRATVESLQKLVATKNPSPFWRRVF